MVISGGMTIGGVSVGQVLYEQQDSQYQVQPWGLLDPLTRSIFETTAERFVRVVQGHFAPGTLCPPPFLRSPVPNPVPNPALTTDAVLVVRYRALVLNYGRHKPTCLTGAECQCGFENILKAIEAGEL